MTAIRALDSANLNGGQKLAVKYFTVALALLGVQIIFGMLAAVQFVMPDFLFGVIDFSIKRMVHINALVVWLLFGFIGSVYWMLEEEAGAPTVGLKLGNIIFYVFTAAVLVVVAVYLLVQVGPGEMSTQWLITEGREYTEAPRWADIGIVVCVLVFFYNVAATFFKGKAAKGGISGIGNVLLLDLVALAGIYLLGMWYTTNVTLDQYWWWWVIHMWVEATWEVMVGCMMAYALIKVLGTPRKIVTTWLYLEVFMMLGSGILGIGHHYFWIGTPEYWLTIGGFFSALEPLPLVAMVVHAIYDSGVHKSRNTNHPAMGWLIAHAFGNFFGAGVWGFIHTLPQINMYTHGTQWSASHGHFAFYGAYATINIAFFYMAMQKWRGDVWMSKNLFGAWKWKWSMVLLNVGMLGMVMGMLVAGFAQSQIERAIGGATWTAFFAAQEHPWFVQGMYWRLIFGCMFSAGYVLLVWDMLTIGKRETRAIQSHGGDYALEAK